MPAEPDWIDVGVAEGGGRVRMPLTTALRHALVVGSSGSGKSGMVLSLALQVLRSARRARLVVLDPKGELAEELLDRFLPALAGGAVRGLAPGDVVSICPFGGYGVPLNPLRPMEGLEPEAQAHLVAAMVGALVEGGLGPRMSSILEALALAFIGVGGNLAEVRRALTDGAFRARVAGRVSDPGARRYLEEVLPGEPQSSADALRARLDHLLLLPRVRAMLCADGCVPGEAILESGLAVVDVGGAPQGMKSVGRFLGSLLYAKVAAAVFARPSRGVPPAVVVMDEFHELVKSCEDDVERMLTMARFKRVGCHMITQSAEQIPPGLRAVVRTNCAWFAAFRPDGSDVAHLDALLPLTGRRPDPERPDRLLTEEQEKRMLLRELGRLPPRHALVADALAGESRVARTLSLPYAAVAETAGRMPGPALAAWRRGRFGVPFADLRPRDFGEGEGAAPQPAPGPPRGPSPAQKRRLVLP